MFKAESPNRNKSILKAAYVWSFADGSVNVFLNCQQNNIFRCLGFFKKYNLGEMDYTLSTVIKPMLPSLVYVVQTWLQGVKLLISKPPLCFCSPDVTFGRV